MMLISFTCSFVLILIVWFKTDALPTYAKLFGLGDFLYINEYLEDSDGKSFPQFLYVKYPNFFTKMCMCPICFTIFWNLMFLFSSSMILIILFGIITFLTVLVYFPVYLMSCLFLYYLFNKLIS